MILTAMLVFTQVTDAPPSTWRLINDGCSLVRDLDAGEKHYLLRLSAGPLSDTGTLSIIDPSTKGAGGRPEVGDNGAIDLDPSQERLDGQWFRSSSDEGTTVGVRFPRVALDRVARATTARLSVGGKSLATLSMNGAQAALPELAACTAARMRSDGLDPAEDAALAAGAPAPKPLGTGLSLRDYPKDALRRKEEGPVGMILTVSPEGRVSDCRVVASSGFADLDKATCVLLKERMRYTTVPQGGHVRYRVDWNIPR